jgi:hypothetical protein
MQKAIFGSGSIEFYWHTKTLFAIILSADTNLKCRKKWYGLVLKTGLVVLE